MISNICFMCSSQITENVFEFWNEVHYKCNNCQKYSMSFQNNMLRYDNLHFENSIVFHNSRKANNIIAFSLKSTPSHENDAILYSKDVYIANESKLMTYLLLS